MKKMIVSFILDETGSMDAVKTQTISGFNEYVNSLKKEKNSKNVSFALTKFNSDKVEVVYDGVPLANVTELSDQNYRPNFTTPLYDAIGRTIHALQANGKENVLIVIQTDGQENSSREFTQQAIFDLIAEKKKAGWTFVFLGADMDAYAASASLGISKGNTANYSSSQTSGAFRRVATASLNYVSKGGTSTADFFKGTDDEVI